MLLSVLYEELKETNSVDPRWSFSGLTDDQIEKLNRHGTAFYRGKVREVIGSGEKIEILHSDRLSAFDRHIGLVPQKGVILAELSEFWLKKATEVVATHLIERRDPRTILVKNCQPVKVEVVVRGYLAGSMLRAYQNGERNFCGQKLPEGLHAYGRLPQPMITPTTKAEIYEHDENTTEEEILSKGICTPSEWGFIKEKALQLFAMGQEVYAQKGWLMCDTKYEFGRLSDGSVILIDELHTPDSSRLWVAGDYEERLASSVPPRMFDKENVRRFLIENGFQGQGQPPQVPTNVLVELGQNYLTVAEALTGRELEAYTPSES